MITYLLLYFTVFFNIFAYYVKHRIKLEIAQAVRDADTFANKIKQIKVMILPKGIYKDLNSNIAMKELTRGSRTVSEVPVQEKITGLI